MGRPKNPVGTGRRRLKTLGVHGSPEALAAYRQLLADVEAARPPAPRPDAAIVAEVAVRYPAHAARRYVGADGRPTSEVASNRAAVRVVLAAHGPTRAACALAGVPTWSPSQLRHAFACRVRAAHGLEMTRVLLGHSTTSTSEIYAEKPTAAAKELILRMGSAPPASPPSIRPRHRLDLGGRVGTANQYVAVVYQHVTLANRASRRP